MLFFLVKTSQICLIVSKGNYTVKHLTKNASKVAYRGKQWISYDDPETVYQKVNKTHILRARQSLITINQSHLFMVVYRLSLHSNDSWEA